MSDPDESLSPEQEKEFLRAAETAARTEFDFPPRTGCPDSKTLRGLARRDPSVPDSPDLVDHIGTCSPCFVEYSRYRDEFKHPPRHFYAVACAAMVIIVVITATMLLRTREQSTARPQETVGSQLPIPAPTSPAPAVPAAMSVDLAALSPTRGDNAREPRTVQLPRKPLKLTLLLPLSMEPGSYRIRLRASEGATLIDMPSVGRTDHGVTSLELNLDFSVVPPGRYTLMVRPPGLSWRSYSVVIE